MELWDRAVEFASLLALIVAAWATARTWQSQKHQDAARRPTVTVGDEGTIFRTSAGAPGVVRFSLDKEYRTVWRVEAVTVRWPFWMGALSPFVNPTFDPGSGEPVYSPSLPYRRSVTFGAGTTEGYVFVSGASPRSLLLSFRISMRASPRITSRFDVRISITD